MNTTTATDIADAVRAFYDQHPYPPPVEDLDDYGRRWVGPLRRKADYHLYWPDQPYREGLNILVAGCGTSQAARYALRNRGNHVIGIDVSSTSIRYTETLKDRYNLNNLEVHQLPLERVHELNQHFDLIVCTGVLHHLPDPDSGLHALGSVLDSYGAMHIMVYAAYGRAGIYMLQEYCRRLGIGRSREELNDLANTLLALPFEHQLTPLMSESPDFRTRAGLADALLNPQERAYTVPQFFDFIDSTDLSFGRWVRQAPYLPQCGNLALSPHFDRLNRLTPIEKYAAVELLRGTMTRHSAVVYRNGRSDSARPDFLEGEEWQNYVPIRLPHTVCIEENLPAGAAAVLLNRSHTYSDLVLPIDAEQRALYNGIDGERTISEILETVTVRGGGGSLYQERVRTFFTALGQYDQVVFDISRSTG